MRKFSADLKLPFNSDFMLEDVKRDCDRTKLGHFAYDKTKFDPRVTEYLRERGLCISHYEIFFTPAHSLLAIHVDGSKLSNIVKLNWVWGGTGRRMMWWKMREGCSLTQGTTPVNTPYLYAEQRQCIMIESAKIGRPTLVNVGQPHSVVNATPEDRWCLSAVLAGIEEQTNLEWDAVVEKLGADLE